MHNFTIAVCNALLTFLRGLAAGSVQSVWDAPGVDAPHDFALVAAPLAVSGTGERMLGLAIAETRPSGSAVRRLTFVPSGECAIDRFK